MAHDATAHTDDHSHFSTNTIFVALCICTAVSWFADEAFDLGFMTSRKAISVIVMAVAVAKAQFVMRYFMHLKFEGRWKYVLLLPTAILACGLPLALAPDIALHYYTEDPELALAVDESHHAAGHGTETHESESHAGEDGADE
jgi:cytochrome c oxidase subunit 4